MDDVAKYYEHSGRYDTSSGSCEGGEESEDGDGESRPAGIDTQRGKKDGDETGACTGQE